MALQRYLRCKPRLGKLHCFVLNSRHEKLFAPSLRRGFSIRVLRLLAMATMTTAQLRAPCRLESFTGSGYLGRVSFSNDLVTLADLGDPSTAIDEGSASSLVEARIDLPSRRHDESFDYQMTMRYAHLAPDQQQAAIDGPTACHCASHQIATYRQNRHANCKLSMQS